MVSLTLTNRRLFISGADRETIRALEAVTSYRVAGFQFAPSFKSKHWDGKEHLLTFSRKLGYYVPAGLLLDVARTLREAGEKFTLIDKTVVRAKRVDLHWNSDIVLRPYQKDAIRALLSKPAGMGVAKMPIRSGKTKTAARLIKAIGLPTLFIVPSQMLLHQTFEALQEVLPGADIGRIGDGEFNPQFITVSTIQTLDRFRGKRPNKRKGKKGVPQDPRYKQLLTMFDVVIVDEAHHIKGDGDWYRVLYDMDSKYKMALSATVYMENEAEVGKGIIWLKAICGDVKIDIETSALVEQGFLMRQNVRMYTINKPDMRSKRWSQTLRKRCITLNPHRNKLIARLAREHSDAGLKVLIVANRFDHIGMLAELMDNEGVDYRIITGKDSPTSRESKLDSLVSGHCNVLIGTVLGEGIDIPSVEVVINAEGGHDDKATVQRQRNLTISEGKTTALMIDFMDLTNPYFEKHSNARLEAYRAEPAFSVKLLGA